MLKVAVLGCCCTGDIFRLAGEGFTLVRYYAGTSIASLLSEPVAIREDDVELTHRFERRTVLGDFRKTFWSEISALDIDCLVVDLIQEGTKLAKVGGNFVTLSEVAARSRVLEKSGYRFTLIDPTDHSFRRIWLDNFQHFARRLLEILPADKIILHRVYQAELYLEQGVRRSFPPERVERVRRGNQNLTQVYDHFAATLPGSHSLDLSRESFAADRDHPWGLTVLHFEPAYYRAAAAALRRIVETRINPPAGATGLTEAGGADRA